MLLAYFMSFPEFRYFLNLGFEDICLKEKKSPFPLHCVFITFQETKEMPFFGAAPVTQPPVCIAQGRESQSGRFFHPLKS